MHAMTAVSSVNQPQNDRKSVVFCKRPARMELFRDAVFCAAQPAADGSPSKSQFSDLTSQARGVCPLPDEPTIQCKCTVLDIVLVRLTNTESLKDTTGTLCSTVHKLGTAGDETSY